MPTLKTIKLDDFAKDWNKSKIWLSQGRIEVKSLHCSIYLISSAFMDDRDSVKYWISDLTKVMH